MHEMLVCNLEIIPRVDGVFYLIGGAVKEMIISFL